MKVTIVGGGLAGVIAANFLKEKSYITEVVIISSPNIAPVGVGESSVPLFTGNLPLMGIDPVDFLKKSKGSVKQGVYYKGWNGMDYINPFINPIKLSKQGIINLGSKPTTLPIKDYLYPEFHESLTNGNVVVDSNMFGYAYHFDTNLAISYLKSKALESEKVLLIEAEVVAVNKSGNGGIESLALSNSAVETADYYINATGLANSSAGVFGEEYEYLSDVLPNNKAIAVSLDYTNKESQFNPYTETKVMRSGWKWTIPTWDKLGVGYVFSTDYISVDDAKAELAEELGLEDISPFVISFTPKKNNNTFKENHCSLGLANNFLDPLDSPTLLFVMGTLFMLETVILENLTVSEANQNVNRYVDGFVDYLANQFKSCVKNDTPYWVDLKLVSTPRLDEKLGNLPHHIAFNTPFAGMIALAQSAKDIQFISSTYPTTEAALPSHNYATASHYEYIQSLHTLNN